MTIKDMINKIDRFNQQLRSEQTYFELMNFIISEQSERIFVRGLNDKNSDIGTYDTKPLYVNPKNAPRSFPVKGKTGKTKFNNGKSHKTGYFNGYGQYKQTIGEGSRVNLRLFRNFEVAYNTSGRFTFTDSKLIYSHGVRVSAKNPQGKIEGLKAKYPDAFGLSKVEREIFIKGMTEIVKSKL